MSGSRGPLSKSDAVRRNKEAPPNELPADGYQGEIPSWPFVEGHQIEELLWEDLWRTPIAVEWAKAGLGVHRQVARLVRMSLNLEVETRHSVASAQTLSALLMLEKSLGIGPEAIKRLGLIIRDADPEPAEKLAPVRRLKAVDPEAS